MRDGPILTVLLVVVIVAFAGALVYTLVADKDNSSADSIEMNDLVDHWYLVYEAEYSDDGYVLSTPENAPHIHDNDLDIYGYDGDVFYGSQSDVSLTGSYVDGVLKFIIESDGDYSLCRGYMDGNDSFSIVNAHGIYNGGVLEDLVVSIQVYTNDPNKANDVPDVPGYEDVTGDWKVSTDVLLVNGNYTQFGYDAVNISYQNENLFEAKYNTKTTADLRTIRCAFLGHGDRYSGVGITTEGRIMLMDLKDDVMSFTNVASNESYVYAVYTAFTRSGEPIESVESGLVGTDWRVTDSHSITGDGVIESDINRFTLSFTDEKDCVIKGTWTYGLEKKDIAGYVKRNSIGLLVEFIWNEDDISDVFKVGYLLDNGIMTLSDIYTNDATDVPTARTYTLEKIVTVETDLVGHWYVTDIVGYDTAIYHRNLNTSMMMPTMDFDIYEVTDDGLLYGYVSFNNICGSYADGLFNFDVSIMDGNVNMTGFGWVESDNTLSLVVTTDAYGVTSIHYATYTKERGSVTNLEPDFDVMGDWVAVNPRSMTSDGTVVPMMGINMTIDEQIGAAFGGTMQQMSGTDIIDVTIKGCIVVTPWGTIQGRIIDSNGLVWGIQFVEGDTPEGDTFMINATDISPAAPIAGQMDTVERRYHRAGVSDPGFDYMGDMTGRTWCGTSSSAIDVYGEKYESDVDFYISVDHQMDNNISGTCRYIIEGTEIGGTWVGYLINSIGQPMYSLQVSTEEYGVCQGITWIYNEKIHIILYPEIEPNVWCATCTDLTEVIQ